MGSAGSNLKTIFLQVEGRHILPANPIEKLAMQKASVSRELTKVFEENIRYSLADLVLHFKDKKIRGEFVIVVEGKS